MRDKYLQDNPVCQCGRNGCRRPSEDVHHKEGREGDLLFDITKFLAVARVCHVWIGNHPKEAVALGLSILKLINPMTRVEIEEKIKKILVNDYSVDEDEITPEAKLMDDFALDSLDSVEFIMKIEKDFHLIIPDSIAEEIHTFKDVVDYLEKYAGEKE